MTITKIALNFDDSTNVEVTTSGNFYIVQTVDRMFRSDLGCIVTDKNGTEVDYDDDDEIIDIIDQAENFIIDAVKEERTDHTLDNSDVYLIHDINAVHVVTRNGNYVNKHTSSYQREFSDAIASFDTRKEALESLS